MTTYLIYAIGTPLVAAGAHLCWLLASVPRADLHRIRDDRGMGR